LIDERTRERDSPVAAAGPEAVEPGGETSFADLEAEPEAADARRALIVVDDDPLFATMAGERLDQLGFRVVACATVAAGLAAVEREAASGEPAVVADIVMPTLDNKGFLGGLELMERIRRSHPQVPDRRTAYPTKWSRRR
jgi:CheY-like chemotaxis protein